MDKIKIDVSKDKFYMDIENCVRCGENHKNVKFLKFTRPHHEDETNTTTTHYAYCPSNGEPIQLKSWENE